MSQARDADRGHRRCARRSLLAVALTVLLGACSSHQPESLGDARTDDVVRVASFDFAESELVAELFAQSIEQEGVEVQRVRSLGSREVVQPALQQGFVDVVPEYLAAALDFETFGADVPTDPEGAADRLQEALRGDGVRVLPHAAAVDRDAVAMHSPRAAELDVRTLDDLAEHADQLDFVAPPECPERSACLPHLEGVYGIEFRSFTALPPGPSIALALAAGEADVGLVFSSDPLVAEHDLVLLRDERGRGRPEHVVPLVREEVLEEHPEISGALERVTESLDTATLVELNGRVAAGEDHRLVARDWLRSIR